jgi:hypothetical protein
VKRLSCVLCAVGLITACRLDLDDVRAPRGESSHDAGGPESGALQDGAVFDGKDGGEPEGPVHHEACAMPLPSVLPPEPFVAMDARGRPVFDYYRDLPCDDPVVEGYPTCEEYAGQPAIECVYCAGATRLCQTWNSQVPGERCAPLTMADPSCVTCVPPAAKRRACCEGLDPSCEPWPFEGKVKTGGACAVHADCEPGLVCIVSPEPLSESVHYAYGLCACPEAPYPATQCSVERVSSP